MRKLTISEHLGLFLLPMSMKYKILEKIHKEGHAYSIGKGESQGPFGFWVTSSVSLQWKDRTRKPIRIERQPVFEIVFILVFLLWSYDTIHDLINWINRITSIEVTLSG